MSKLSPLNRDSRGALDIQVNNPSAVAECDGCGFWVMRDEMREQQDYRGGLSPVGTGFWKCRTCYDVPQMQPGYMKIVLPPDPVPVSNPRPPNYSLDPDQMIFVVASIGGSYIVANADGPTFLMAQNPGI